MPTIIASQDHNLDPSVFQKPRHSGRSRKLKLCPMSEPLIPSHSYQGRKFKLSEQESQKMKTLVQNHIHCSSYPSGLPSNSNQTKRNPKSQRAFVTQTQSNYALEYHQIDRCRCRCRFYRHRSVLPPAYMLYIADTSALTTLALVQYPQYHNAQPPSCCFERKKKN